ncbi:hypothetical protein L596_001306 [Steinernema carpocapsae]|uniref:HHH domain-containing protein n=1 Tax=Steinernema carpocapsae TaxID=34508 RepID=A0A4U8UL35_STECR|nr:hypothetical protein L596_001306 [Steinernema carpocapsae]
MRGLVVEGDNDDDVGNILRSFEVLKFGCSGAKKEAALWENSQKTGIESETRSSTTTISSTVDRPYRDRYHREREQHVADRADSYVEILDRSRVHPETYEWAHNMAVDALEIEDSKRSCNHDRLRDLDLEAFAQELSQQNFGSKGITLYDIRAELTCRYKDLRPPYMPLDRETVFFLLTKESPETFCEGQFDRTTALEILSISEKMVCTSAQRF